MLMGGGTAGGKVPLHDESTPRPCAEPGFGKKKSRRGFASTISRDPEWHREIASKGGKRAHEMGVAHQFTEKERQAAGRKGGAIVAKDRAHMVKIGRKGGLARAAKRKTAKNETIDHPRGGGEWHRER